MSRKTVFKVRFAPGEFQALWAQAQENERTLAGCAGHRFPPLRDRFDARYRCESCGGEAKADYIVTYCAGFAAAGGDPREVCPNIDGEPT